MTDKKEPPFFNDESVGGFHYKLPLYDIIELFIETLTGTCFELRVFPFEAVISVKAKIQRLEGIPVAQQHLIWNNLELDDERCLHDYGIAGGCTLKLVLAMRGGPINIRRVTMEDPIKEVTDLMENTKDEGWEKSSPNKPVTFVLYREGDRLNFFKVIDRGDGTLTPLSESLSTCSMHNVCIDEEEDGESCAAVQQSLENAITMNKMKLLKAKMEDMNLNKKPKKLAKIKPRPPVSPHPFSGSAGSSVARHHHRLSRWFSHVNQPRQSNPLLPPISDQKSVDPSSASAATISSHFSIHRQPPPSFSPTSCYVLQEEEPWDTCPPFANIRPPPKVSRLDMGSTRLMRDCIYPQPPPPCARGPPDANYDPAEPAPEAVRLGLLEEAVGLGMPTQPGTLFAELSDPLSLDVSILPDRGSRSLEVGAQHQMPLSPSPLSTWTLGTSDTLTSRDDWTLLGTSLHINPPSQMHAPASPSTTTRYLPHNPHAQSSAQVKPGSTSPHLPTSPSANPPRLHGVTVESLGKRPELISKSNTRSIIKMNNQACREPLGSLSKSDFVASLSTRASESMDSLNKSLGHALAFPRATASEQGRLGSRLPTFPTNRLLQDDLMRQMSPFHTATAPDMAPPTVASAGGLMASIERLGKTCHLPPVKAPAGSKKKNFKHCFHCSKKTGLATSYECRCGQNFCATHRYAETHDCTFDYKNAGRQFLQETNPLVSAPKLPKI